MASVQGGSAGATAVKRGGERAWRAGLTGVTSVISHGIALGASLYCVRITIGYLGAERYGIWLTMSSVLAWLAVTDLGLGGYALVNALSEAHGRDDRVLARKVVGTAFWTLVGIAMVLATAGLLIFPHISWSAAFRASHAVSESELRLAMQLAFASFVLLFPLSGIEAVYKGHQEGYIGDAWAITGSVLMVVSILLVTRFEGGLPALVLASAGSRTLLRLSSGIYAFFRRYPWLAPGRGSFDRECFRRLSGLGGKYLVTQLAGVGLYQSQPMIITHVLGPAHVTVFHVTHRLMALTSSLCWTATQPLVSAYGEARERRDWPWIRGAFRISMLLSVAAGSLVLGGFVLFAHEIIRAWVGPAVVEPGGALALALGVYGFLLLMTVPIGMLLYGLQRVGAVAVCAVANVALTIPASIVLGERFGLIGIAGAMAGSFLVTSVFGLSLQAYRALRALDDRA